MPLSAAKFVFQAYSENANKSLFVSLEIRILQFAFRANCSCHGNDIYRCDTSHLGLGVCNSL